MSTISSGICPKVFKLSKLVPMLNFKEGSLLHNFLAIHRWKTFFNALSQESTISQNPPLSIGIIIIAFVITLLPVLSPFVPRLPVQGYLDFPTLFFGIATILAILFRKRIGLELKTTKSWKESLSLTHTGFALGCLPVVVLLAIYPELLAERFAAVQHVVEGPSTDAPTRHYLTIILTVIGISLWAGVTEEFVFRGLLLSSLRRTTLLNKQSSKDIIAVIFSASLFGLAHYPSWGLGAAIAVTGLGIGLGMAYIANGERLLPLVVYHSFFDLLSFTLLLSL